MSVQFQLVMHSGPNPGTEFPLKDPEIVIGREKTCNLVINDVEISRKHARLIWQASNYVIEDLGSTNGTFINGNRLSSPFILQGGEIITLGEKTVLNFESNTDPDATRLSASQRPVRKEKVEVKPVPNAQVPVNPSLPSKLMPANGEKGHIDDNWKSRISKINKRLVIILGIVFLILCGCSLLAIYLFNAPPSFWCKTLPFIFNPQNYNCIP